ncbi:phage head morphogenesis protein [Paenibacillus agricola]|nr:phage minor head protein [Paenibacillus agricola]
MRAFANSKGFLAYAQATAMKMVTHLFSDSGRTWRQAAAKNSQGRRIYEALQKELAGPLGAAVMHQVNRNAELIGSMPLDLARKATQHILEESLKGTRSSSIAEQLKLLFPDMSNAQAALIARTESSKTSTALTEARSLGMGVHWYVWKTSEDSRVRDSHARMDGVLVNWNDPPSPELLDGMKSYGHYHCGGIFNCRCYPEPVIDLDLIAWPAKVYRNGSITRMTRKQFEQIAA